MHGSSSVASSFEQAASPHPSFELSTAVSDFGASREAELAAHPHENANGSKVAAALRGYPQQYALPGFISQNTLPSGMSFDHQELVFAPFALSVPPNAWNPYLGVDPKLLRQYAPRRQNIIDTTREGLREPAAGVAGPPPGGLVDPLFQSSAGTDTQDEQAERVR